MYSCCSEIICMGCIYANIKSNIHDRVKAGRCPFCREPAPNDEENDKRLKKRMKANDPVALSEMGLKLYLEGEFISALEYLTKAAELGEANAHYELARMHHEGRGVEKDDKKEVYHCEKAAIGGHTHARFNLGWYEERNGNMKRSVKHFVIAANLGCDESMKGLWRHYSEGNITKEDLEATIRTHQAALDAMKSPEREKVEEAIKNGCPIAAIKLE